MDFFKYLSILFSVHVCACLCAHAHVHLESTCVPETTEVEDALDPLELELQTIVGFHVGAGNQSSARIKCFNH